jgi:hypothetical protein
VSASGTMIRPTATAATLRLTRQKSAEAVISDRGCKVVVKGRTSDEETTATLVIEDQDRSQLTLWPPGTPSR